MVAAAGYQLEGSPGKQSNLIRALSGFLATALGDAGGVRHCAPALNGQVGVQRLGS